MLNTFLLVIVLSVELYHLSLTLTEGRSKAVRGELAEAGRRPCRRESAGGR